MVVKHGTPCTVTDGVCYPVGIRPSSRKNSFITLDQIDREYPEIINKISEVLYYDDYTKEAKDYVRSLLDFMLDHDFLSWKQFDSVVAICRYREEYYRSLRNGTRVFTYSNVVTIKRGPVGFTFRSEEVPDEIYTDYDFDSLYERVFGFPPVFEEELNGYRVDYRDDGSRFFAL